MNSLETRFDAVQDQILNLYEKGSKCLADHILYWELVRKEGALQFCARRGGLNKLGLQPLPSTIGAENKAKRAIQMQLVLTSLNESPFGSEEWTMAETSREMYDSTEPYGTFKKSGEEVEVYYGGDEDNNVSYMLWKYVYAQDENGNWHKYQSDCDYYGVHYTDHSGTRIYYHDFDSDSRRYGDYSHWTVNYKHKTFESSPDSSSSAKEGHQKTTRRPEDNTATKRTLPTDTTDTAAPAGDTIWGRGGGYGRLGQGERQTCIRKAWSSAAETPAGPEGSAGPCQPNSIRHHHTHRPIISVKGPTNSLKCWRNRLRRRTYKPYSRVSTAFQWVEDRADGVEVGDRWQVSFSNVLVAFADTHQKEVFLKTVTLPKGCSYTSGFLDGL
ncbi:E2 [Mus musculus papillomavirus type 1]|uniref:Regulatory protein E2 n=1 Tax=Mus musculus papillomavirus type 1 TaxID=763552 RepID=F8SIL9_9PAPI|nr:E2 [Mus musculus papillomavirus type 1]